LKCSLLSFSFYGFNLASSFSPSSVPRQLFVVAPLKCHFASDGVGFLPIVPSIRRWGTTTVIICEESRYGGPGCRSSRARHPCTCAWLLRELRWLSQIGVNGSRRPDPLLRHIGHMVAVSCKGLLRSSKSKFECSPWKYAHSQSWEAYAKVRSMSVTRGRAKSDPLPLHNDQELQTRSFLLEVEVAQVRHRKFNWVSGPIHPSRLKSNHQVFSLRFKRGIVYLFFQ